GSLTERRVLAGDEVDTFAVSCRTLSAYLTEPVNFLKLDIEGLEADVLEEARDHLHQVEQIFCEVHEESGAAGKRLARVLGVLETAGFDVHVGKSHSYQQLTRQR